jgi:heterodisulfide reductase subunit C
MDELDRLREETRLRECLECGKCTSCCPYRELFGDLRMGRSPRRIVKSALDGTDVLTGEQIWACPTCDECTNRCPSGVKIRDLITGLRRLAIGAGHDSHAVRCRSCGSYLLPDTSHTHLVKQLTPAGEEPAHYLFLCPRCRAQDHARREREALGLAHRAG